MMQASTPPQAVHLTDYRPPDFLVPTINLEIDLDDHATIVRADLAITHQDANRNVPLVLNGRGLDLVEIALDHVALDAGQYHLAGEDLILDHPPRGPFSLQITTRINPSANSALEGLFQSNHIFCTQCEAQGFRRITYFPDRPDILSVYSVTISADRDACPVLLSNGNLVAQGQSDDGRHWVKWHDPFPKPSYLFALVGGALFALKDQFTTRSGRVIDLGIWVEAGNVPRANYAMDSLKRAMAWDETVFGLEYDLDIFNIVAVADFNMGAMENKGLNVFNSKYILADPDTATDADYAGIERVVAHEYFHNWTGNRVTCRDWFQLSLKEGLTVFRDQEFCRDQRGHALQRIGDVQSLRARQFPEDAGPLAHPVRPPSYVEISNFYTATIYEKGAELVRMIETLVGRAGFLKGHRLYIDRHDGTAATVDDFVRAMADANDIDLSAFMAWYNYAGTPRVTVEDQFDPASHRYDLKLSQAVDIDATPSPPRVIPLRLGLLDEQGNDLALNLIGHGPVDNGMIIFDQAQQTFSFGNISKRPRLSINRDFSAPVKIVQSVSDDDAIFLIGHDRDPFARFEALQSTALRLLLPAAKGEPAPDATGFIQVLGRIIQDQSLDPGFVAEALRLPSERIIADHMEIAAPESIFSAREHLRRAIGQGLRAALTAIYDRPRDTEFRPDAQAASARSLRNAALSYLTAAGDDQAAQLGYSAYSQADNMTDRLAALACLVRTTHELRDSALADFLERYRDNALVIDKWFTLQATAPTADCLDHVIDLTRHALFTPRTPNKVRSLIGAFASGNPLHFHDLSGRAYRFLGDWIVQLDAINPSIAARMMEPLTQWRRLDHHRARLMREQLQAILARPGLSKDCFEIATKGLAQQ
jgi:aminopeptidase N